MSQKGNDDYDKSFSLPRVNHQFVGIGHQLASHQKSRRQVELEQRTVENRVLHLEKEEAKAKKLYQKKKEELERIISVKERQDEQNEQKRRLKQQKIEELEMLRRQRQYMRIMHKTNLESTISAINDRNRNDYTRIRKQRMDGEYRKRANREEDYQQKRDHWLSLNISKEKGRMKVDQFFKKKNYEHLAEYQSRIQNEGQKINKKINSIKALEAKESMLREKLEQTTLKNSRMEELIKGASRVHSPLDTKSIEAELYASTSRKNRAIKMKGSNQTISFTDRQSTDMREMSAGRRDQVEEDIEMEEVAEKQGSVTIIHKRRRNKHVNRYRQYEAF